MDASDHIGTAEHQLLIAALLVPEVINGQGVLLNAGAHCAVVHNDAFFQDL